MTATAPPDRQAKPPVLSEVVKVRLSQQIHSSIVAAATARGMTKAGWIRNAALTSLMLEGIKTLVTFPEALTDEPE